MSLLNVHVYGPDDGLPVLALHGVTGHCLRWRPLAVELPEVRLVAVDLRGHGRSPWTPPWTLEQHVTDVLDTLDHLGLHRLPVVGHSFGGAVALHLARAARERVDRLVLIDPALGLDPGDMLEAALETCAGESYGSVAEARAERARTWDGVPDHLVDAEIADHLVEDETGRLRWRWCPPAVVTTWSEVSRPAILPPADVPTLLLPAAKADYVRPEWVAQLGPLTTVQEFDTGHMVYLERPAETAAAIRSFLA